MARPLEVDWRQEGLVYAGAIADSRLSKVTFYGKKKEVVGLDFAVWSILVAKHLDSAINFGAQEKRLRLQGD